jgi:hypothetical protein
MVSSRCFSAQRLPGFKGKKEWVTNKTNGLEIGVNNDEVLHSCRDFYGLG